ncbi:MAG: TlpA disulfide reductase family protein [Actinomycetota bacterium]
MRTDLPRRSGPSIAAILAVAVGLLAAACGGGGSPGGSSAPRSPVPATNAAEAALLPTDAQALPAASYEDYRQLLSQLEGTPVVVNIWGSWCGPCRDEIDDLVAAAHSYGGRVQFLGVDILDARDSARAFMDEFGVTYPSLFDPSPGGDIRNQLGYVGQPVTIFYDAAGEKVADWEGPISAERLHEHLEALVNTP